MRSAHLLAVLLLVALPVIANPVPLILESAAPGLAPFSLKYEPGIRIATEDLLIEDGWQNEGPLKDDATRLQDQNAMAVSNSLPDKDSQRNLVRVNIRYTFENSSAESKSMLIGFPTVRQKDVEAANQGSESFSVMYGDTKLAPHQLEGTLPMYFPRDLLKEIEPDLLKSGLAKRVEVAPNFLNLQGLGNSVEELQQTLNESRSLSRSAIARIVRVLRKVAFSKHDYLVNAQSKLWHLFDLTIEPGTSKELTVSYNSYQQKGPYRFSYILTTGSFWGESIGSLNVRIKPDANFVKSGGFYEFMPDGIFTRRDGVFLFHAKNFSPKFDIAFKRKEPSATSHME